jgi:ergothioneine biosynthesis protein EgtB
MATQAQLARKHMRGDRYEAVRALSVGIAAPLSDADATLQAFADASPAKWHLAHSSWFFETFVLRDHVADYRVRDPRWGFLFNSYYEGEGKRHARDLRGMLSRPALGAVLDYRAAVDEALLRALPLLEPEALRLVDLGLEHEQQHQELMLTDILAAFAKSPLRPALFERTAAAASPPPPPLGSAARPGGIYEVGAAPGSDFSFDCERPRHPVLLQAHQLGDRLVANAEWLRFIADGGYETPSLWLSDGWAWVCANAIEAPLYWERSEESDDWHLFGLDGLHPVDPAEPVCHISYYEADAFARWAGARLPTEFEWEAAASAYDPAFGNQLDTAGAVRPLPAQYGNGLRQMYGDVWEWTASAYLPYPGFTPEEGTVGEYNGKFMANQFVLRGGSCATPRGHVRASYRNFFYPHQRWQFCGLRLARNA